MDRLNARRSKLGCQLKHQAQAILPFFCQSELENQVRLQQRNVMRTCLSYKGRNHKKFINKLFTIVNLLEFCRSTPLSLAQRSWAAISYVPTCLKLPKRVKYIKQGKKDFHKNQDIVDLLLTITRGIGCKIEVKSARRRVLKFNSRCESHEKKNHNNRDDSVAEMTKHLTCAASHAITTPWGTVWKIGGWEITRDRRAETVTTATQYGKVKVASTKW